MFYNTSHKGEDMLDLKIKLRKQDNVPIIDLTGEVDVYTYPQLNQAIATLIDEGNYHMVINLEEVKYIDSTGIGVIANGASRIAEHNGHLNIICTKPQVKKIFVVSGLLNKNLTLYEDESSAITNARTSIKPRKSK
jgi:anti-sigma B factor antagonist